MAIMGFLVHTLKEDVTEVEARIRQMPEMTTYGIHQDQYIVVVSEAVSDRIEKVVDQVKELPGVLTIYTTYLTIEDEMDENGNIETNLSLRNLMKKKPGIDIQ
jgi:nitrate reductase NapAB chaperone NapD